LELVICFLELLTIYHQILLSLFNNNKTLYDMDSTQLEFIREQAYKCPVDLASANAQSVLYLLFGEEVPECEPMTTRSSRILVKPVDFIQPDSDAYIEDNFPDPFIDKTMINYYLPDGENGVVIITDMYGRNIKSYRLENGENTLEIDAKDLMPGVYNYGMYVNDKPIEFRKMIITQ
jgi:hypothetical protein